LRQPLSRSDPIDTTAIAKRKTFPVAHLIDWRGMSGLRDIVARQYHRIEMELLRPVINDEFPPLIEAMEAELQTSITKP
jgi:uncharacterized protein with HEPN domain